jgi:5,10-methylenetetrahydromethanopterin reductase
VVGVALDGMIPLRAMLDLVRLAEHLGVPDVWMAEHMGYRDGLTTSMAILSATTTTVVAPTAIGIFTRHPMIAAMSAATLDELAPGRTLLVLATGNPRALGELGVPVERPVTAMREYAAVIRALWRGAPTTFPGEIFRLRDAPFHVSLASPPPLWIAAMGPHMLRLAGEIADGVVLSGALSPKYIRHSLGFVKEGAARAGHETTLLGTAGFIITSVSRDGAAARRQAKQMLAYLFRNRFVAENLAMEGSRVDRAAVADAAARGDWDTAFAGIPDDEVTTHAIAGTPSECRRQLDAFRDAGLDRPVLLAIGDLESRRLAVELAGAAR